MRLPTNENPCVFCSGEKVLPERYGDGYRTPMTTIRLLFNGVADDSCFIQWNAEEGLMHFNNSSGEYADCCVEIAYCPLCGKSLQKG